jgi:hypothetical protein
MPAKQAQRSGAQARNRRFDQRQASSIEHLDRGISHSIKFADPFAHSLLSVTGRVENVSHVLIEAFVTQRPTSRRYTCGPAALAGNADAAPCFLQAIDSAHLSSAKTQRPSCSSSQEAVLVMKSIQDRVRHNSA